jgi:hypothetical protein
MLRILIYCFRCGTLCKETIIMHEFWGITCGDPMEGGLKPNQLTDAAHPYFLFSDPDFLQAKP